MLKTFVREREKNTVFRLYPTEFRQLAKLLIHTFNMWGHSLTNMLYTNRFAFKICASPPHISHTTECKMRYFLSNVALCNFKHINPSPNRYHTFIHLNVYSVLQISTRTINIGPESLTFYVSYIT